MAVLEDVLNFINCSRFFQKSSKARIPQFGRFIPNNCYLHVHVPTLDQIDATIQNVHILIHV